MKKKNVLILVFPRIDFQIIKKTLWNYKETTENTLSGGN